MLLKVLYHICVSNAQFVHTAAFRYCMLIYPTSQTARPYSRVQLHNLSSFIPVVLKQARNFTTQQRKIGENTSSISNWHECITQGFIALHFWYLKVWQMYQQGDTFYWQKGAKVFLRSEILNRSDRLDLRFKDWSPKFETRQNIIIGIVQKV